MDCRWDHPWAVTISSHPQSSDTHRLLKMIGQKIPHACDFLLVFLGKSVTGYETKSHFFPKNPKENRTHVHVLSGEAQDIWRLLKII